MEKYEKCSNFKTRAYYKMQQKLIFYLDFALENFAKEIQEKIYEEIGFTCSIGIGPNLDLAKILMNQSSNSIKVLKNDK